LKKLKKKQSKWINPEKICSDKFLSHLGMGYK